MCLQSPSSKRRSTQNSVKSSSTSINNVIFDENQVTLLTEWLEQLNQERLITTTDQNDIVIMAGGKNDQDQQIFINYDDLDAYMTTKAGSGKKTNEVNTILMSDIARILLKCGYISESSGQLSFRTETIATDSKNITWLTSMIRDARPDPKSHETHVKLFDGENTQLLRIPYEFMPPTNNAHTVAIYLYRNGRVRYDVDTGTFAYRYIEPDILLDDETKSPERISQRQLLFFHIRQIHVNEKKEHVELEFLYEPIHRLVLPTRWYQQVLAHDFDKDYIIDILLANGGFIDRNEFVFMGRAYSLKESSKTKANTASVPSTYLRTANLSLQQKHDLICRYVDLINEKNGIKLDATNRLLVLQNPTDGHSLYFTPEHSQFIEQNDYDRQDAIEVLVKYGQIKQDKSGNWLLHYNNQYIHFPTSVVPYSSQNINNNIHSQTEKFPSNIQKLSRPITPRIGDKHSEAEFRQQYQSIIDYMCRHGLVTWNKRSKLIKLHFADQTLLLPIDHLRSIVNPRVLSSSSTTDNILPFTSRQLSQWLINNSYMTRKTN